MKKYITFFSVVLGSVLTAYALSDGEKILEGIVTEFFSPAYKLCVGVAFLYFLYGVMRFIYGLSNPDERTVGKSHLLWGMIGLFIIFSVGGIIKLADTFFGWMFSY
mgnify:CR=1 FL=1